MTEPRSEAELWARRMKTAELNRMLCGLSRDGKDLPDHELLEAIRAEKDRRLSDPNGNDFRPQFN